MSNPTALAAFSDDAFAAAAATEHGERVVLAIGAMRIAVHFDDCALRERLAPAWAPLLSDDGGPADVTIWVASHARSGPPPAPPWGAGAYRPRDEVTGFGSAALEVAYQLVPGTLMLWDEARSRGLWWTRTPAEIPVWETAMPLRTVLRWALRGRGLALLHGAAVGDQRGYLLLAGAGGSGKSTSALAAPRAGLRYLADDYCAFDAASGRLYPLTRFAKATDATLDLLPELRSRLADLPRSPEGKALVDAPLTVPTAEAPAVLRAIVCPRVGTATSAPALVDAATAMAALAPTTRVQLPGSRPADQELLAAAVRSVPAYTLTVGPDPGEVAATLDTLLSTVGAA